MRSNNKCNTRSNRIWRVKVKLIEKIKQKEKKNNKNNTK